MNAAATPASADKSGFRDLRVTAKIRESSAITSFYLEALDPQGWRPFQPGQFLVLRLPQDGKESVLRNYSLSCSPERKDGYRITVKREAAPSAGLPDGVGSCYLHDRIQVGDVLTAQGPRGDFVLDSASQRPVALLSGGVGLTPLVSMLHALCATTRRTWFIHACDNGQAHALRDEVEALAASRPGVSVHFCYRFPTETDKVAGRYHSEGVVTRELLQRLLPLDDYDFYLCGPSPFMQAVHGILRGLGVAKERIAYEFFGPATLLEPAAAQPPPPPAKRMADAIAVEFRKSNRTAVWDGTAQSLLTFAESQGLAPEFSCRVGVCGSCAVRLLAGEVSYFQEPLDAPDDGYALLCCARPRGPIALDL